MEYLSRTFRWVTSTTPMNDLKLKKVLDAGCGTGEISCSLALNSREVVGIDMSTSSLKKAKNLAEKFKLKNVEFRQDDLLNLGLDEKFDHIFSIGVLHHTEDPFKSFENLVRLLKNKGYITIWLYHTYGMAYNDTKLGLLRLLGVRKMSSLRKIYSLKYKNLTNEQIMGLADLYLHPLRYKFTLKDVLGWFKKTNIGFVGSDSLSNLGHFLKRKDGFFVTGKLK